MANSQNPQNPNKQPPGQGGGGWNPKPGQGQPGQPNRGPQKPGQDNPNK